MNRITLTAISVLSIVGLFAFASASVFAEDAKPPSELKPLHLDTLLVDHGKPNAIIVVADDADYQPLAIELRVKIAAESGGKLTIVKGSQLANGFGQLIGDAPKQNLILIAGPHNNNLVAHLIHTNFCSLETDYPGKGGSVIRTIHNPWGNGVNALLLGGSDVAGAKTAVERFAKDITQGDTLAIPRIVDIVLPAGDADAKAEPTDADIKAELAKQKVNFEQGQQGGLFTPILHAGYSYCRTGKEGYAKLYRDLLYLENDLRLKPNAEWDSPWGGAADFLLGGMFDTWETVEESPSLSTADREKMTGILYDYAHYYRTYWGTKGVLENAILRNNHSTFTCIGMYKAGRYFSKYYHMPEAEEWIKLGDACFAPMIKSFKSQEDCSGYGWINVRHVCNYSLTSSDYSWFTCGKADQAGDLWIMTTDNLGHQATFGDVGGWTGNGQLAMWGTLTDVERNGRYAWAIRKCGGSSEPGTAVHGVEPVEPKDLLGLQKRVTEPLFYDLYKGKNPTPTHERTFDKITMRSSFDPQKPYLLLDGINYAYHGHQDGNSVLRLTDKDRIWLADCDYIKSLPRYHNSMLVLKDGQSGKMPQFADCELAADLKSVGFSSTTIHDYSGTDWRRNIIWDKNGGFVFIDEITAQTLTKTATEPAEISARCVWHTLGKPKLTGNLFQVTQKGPTFSILNLDGARVRYSDDTELGQNWKGYEFADPVVHSVQQVQTRQMKPGERICFINLLTTGTPKAERVSESSALIGSGKDKVLVGVRSGDGDAVRDVTTDARVYWVSAKRIALGDATGLLLHGATVFEVLGGTDKRISFETDLRENATICAQDSVVITVAADRGKLKLDGKAADILPMDNPGGVQIRIPVGTHTLSGLTIPSFSLELPTPAPAAAQRSVVPTGAKQLTEAEKPESGAKILALTADETGVYTGRADGKIDGVFGEKRWSIGAGDAVTAVYVGKLAKDEPARLAAGTSKGKILLLDQSGGKLWDRQLPIYKADPLVDYFTTADLKGDGNRELIVGSDNWQHFAFDAAGNQLWSFMSVRGSSAGTAVDFDGDGKQEIVVGTEYNQIHAIKPDGTERWGLTKIGGPKINAVVWCVLPQTGKPGVVFGGAEGTVYAYDGDGKQVWTYPTGDEVTCMQLCDVNGDGSPEIIAGSRSFSLNAIGRDGKKIWRVDLGEPILSMTLADLNADGKAEICVGTEDGHVFVVDQGGNVVASWATQGPIKKLATLPGTPGRLAVACDDGQLVLLKI